MPSLPDLLAGPRGRRLCAELMDLPSFARPDTADAHARAAVVVRALAAADAEIADRIDEALARCVASARYWQEPDELDVALLANELREPLAAVAEARRGAAMRAPAAGWERRTGTWWSTPPSRMVTTRADVRGEPVRLRLVEEALGWKRAVVRRVLPPRGPRVYEVTDPQAWRALVEQFPFEVTDSRGPDWWRATGRRGRWAIPDWPASLIAGWSPDETYWLTDCVAPDGASVTWRLDNDAWQPARSE
jgi:hypothetical protein